MYNIKKNDNISTVSWLPAKKTEENNHLMISTEDSKDLIYRYMDDIQVNKTKERFYTQFWDVYNVVFIVI